MVNVITKTWQLFWRLEFSFKLKGSDIRKRLIIHISQSGVINNGTVLPN